VQVTIDGAGFIAKVISDNFYTNQAGAIRMSHLGSVGLRSGSNRASTDRMACLDKETPIL